MKSHPSHSLSGSNRQTVGLADSALAVELEIAHKQIFLRTQRHDVACEISKHYNLDPVCGRILAARGFIPDQHLKNFLAPTLREGLPSPSDLRNLEQAAALIYRSILDGEKIAICCDFDVDGLSGGSQVFQAVRELGGVAKVFVPDRFEDGYGLNAGMIHELASTGHTLLITVDFGTTNLSEIELARSLGVKSVVVDHHHVGDHVVSADIFINPCQPQCGFAGKILSAAGLAWYLVVALKNCAKDSSIEPRRYLDLACLGTICDMVPLIGANRVLAKKGLEQLSSTSRPGLIALKRLLGVKSGASCTDVSFGIGPRLNAAGRMVHGESVIDLLTTADSGHALEIANLLHSLNQERQAVEAKVKERAIDILTQRGALAAGLVVADPTFHTGVIGIVAQRLVENFYRPSAVLGLDKDGVYKGSVRGVRGMSVVDTLAAVSKYLIKFGGHEGAGGFSLHEKQLPSFEEAFAEECAKRVKESDRKPRCDVDTEASLDELTVSAVNQLKQFAPFGMGNAQPTVLVRGLEVRDLRVLKGTHLKATLGSGKSSVAGLLWRHAAHPALKIGERVNIAARPEYSTYNGLSELQLTIQAAEVSAR